jgi:endonuclease/exonuclease/phosphatase (EEP) superfamily protein YafD
MLPATESFGRLACLAGMCVAFAGIGMQHFTRHFIYFDALSHLTLHFAIAVIAFGWAFLLPRYRLLSAVAMMVLGMLALGMWVNIHPRELPPRGQDVPEGYRELRVMSFNTWIWNKEQEAIRVEIERQDPDIVFLAEVTSHDLAMSAELLAQFPYQYPEQRRRGLHLRLLSRYPMQDLEGRGVWTGPAYLQGSLGPAWGNLTLIGVHTQRPPRVRAQWNQINAIAGHISTIRQPRLAVGDFNSSPYSYMVWQFAGITGMSRRSVLPTWPATGPGLPQVAIDHMFADDTLRLPDGVLAGRYAGSDHLPIAARVFVPLTGQTASLKPGSTGK